MFCQQLKIHNENMTRTSHETYLGEIVSCDGRNDLNIENRRNKGIGAISQIFTTLKQVHCEVALIMRDTMLISKLIFPSEIWYNITKQQFKKLEVIDERFMRKFLDVPSSTSLIILYIDCGKTNIKLLIKMRRMMYYWQIVNLNKEELVSMFYTAQTFRPVKNDWVVQLAKDKADLGIQNMKDEDVRKIPQQKFKTFLKNKINQIRYTNLREIQEKQSK